MSINNIAAVFGILGFFYMLFIEWPRFKSRWREAGLGSRVSELFWASVLFVSLGGSIVGTIIVFVFPNDTDLAFFCFAPLVILYIILSLYKLIEFLTNRHP